MQMFMTGSRVYGLPEADSDLDLVVYADKRINDDMVAIVALLKACGGVFPVRAGNLNFIFCYSLREFAAWQTAKDECLAEVKKKGNPLDRDTAVGIHCDVFEAYGLGDEYIASTYGPERQKTLADMTSTDKNDLTKLLEELNG